MDILIVESDSRTILDLNTILGKLEHRVVASVPGGEEALKEAVDLNPDLIIINIQLKGEMTGVETARKIEDLYHIPTIFLTVFIKNCLNKSLQLPEDAVVLSMPLREDHLDYAIYRVRKK